MTDASAKSAPPDWFGHPRGLFYLFFAEMWERFCFYGMRNILVLYMVGYFSYKKADAQDGPYGAYTALVYCSAILGGYVADRLIGYRRSIMFGGVLMAAGMFMLLFNDEVLGFLGMGLSRPMEDFFFFTGLATIIVGNGYFKPNISTIVGKLYPAGDPRRDRGFTIFYMGINLGALGGGIICAELGERVSWTLGFGVAAVGMLLGVVTFGTKGCTDALMGHGEPKDQDAAKKSFPKVILASLVLIPGIYFLLNNNPWVFWILVGSFALMTGYLFKVAFSEDKVQREKIFALMILVTFNISFWMLFEQAGSSLTLYAKENLDRSFLGIDLAAGTVQNFNAIFIVMLAPVFAWLWMKTNKMGVEPSTPLKFVLGLAQLGIGFMILVMGARYFSPDGITPLWFMVGLYLLLTTGELCLSPVGLSMVTKLAPERMTGFVMGYWFLSISAALNLAGWIASLTATEEGEGAAAAELTPTETINGYADVYTTGAYTIFGIAALLLVLVPLLKKWMHDVK